MTRFALTGDVGGTNARFALCNMDSGEISNVKTYSGQEYSGLESVIRHYLCGQEEHVEDGCIAIASPVTGDRIEMTNSNWTFSFRELKAQLGLSHLEVINDFTAVSMAIPMLKADDVFQLGGKLPEKGKPIAVYGAGTGLGVAHLIPVETRWLSLPGEGGHVDFAPGNEDEANVLKFMYAGRNRISAERILSGPGLVNLYRSVTIAANRKANELQPEEITEQALSGTCPDCYHALSLFCVMMGRFGGNLALTLGTTGGVYIAGGIVPRFLDFLKSSGFRNGFEDKGRFKTYVQDIPAYLIVHDNPGLLGAGAYLRQQRGLAL